MDAQTILDKFQNVSEEPDGGYIASCSAHTDSRPSLRIWFDDQRVRMTCRAGCETSAVISAADIPWSAMFGVTGQTKTVPAERSQLVGPGEIAALRMFLDMATLRPEHCEYLHDRFGMSSNLADTLGLVGTQTGDGFTHTNSLFAAHPRVVIPLNDFNGVAKGAQGRDISGDCPARWVSLSNPAEKHWQRYGFLDVGGTSVVVTEGPSDACTVVAAGVSALLLRGASLAKNPELVREIAEGLQGKRVFVAGDNDEAGQKFSLTLARGLAEHDVDVYRLSVPNLGPKSDITDWRNNSPATFPTQLFNAMKEAEKVVTATVITSKTAGAVPPSLDEAQEASRIVTELTPRYGVSDVMRAHALVEFTGDRIRYSSAVGFLIWNGTVWECSEADVRHQIHQLGAALNTKGLELGESSKDGFHYGAAKGCTATRSIDAVLTELKSVPGVAIKASDLDAKPDLLSFANGTVDLRTGTLKPHDPDDLITVFVPVDYDPLAECPRWEQFLEEIMPDHPEMPGYLQRLIGYGITGYTSEQCFAVLHGKGSNGKSILVDTLTAVLEAVTKTSGFSTFEERASGGIPNDIAALKDARLVMASEGEANKPMSESVIKSVTGDKNITARFLRKEFFTFTPRFLILLATNHKPKFRGQDEGLWRRVKLIPFLRFFAPDERDYSLDTKLLAEAPGIIAWAVRGAVEWYSGGLRDPDAIIEATKEYRETSDALAGFLGDVVEITRDEDDKLIGKDLFNAYLDWCSAENLPDKEKWRRNTFFAAIEERGAIKRRISSGMAFFGVRMVVHEAEPVEDSGELFM